MSRDYSKPLTKQMLLDMGIYGIYWDKDNNQWWIDRYWYVTRSRSIKRHYRVDITEARCKHKYVKDKVYPKVTFSYLNKPVTISLSRLLYVWFIGDIREGFVVDHIDNDPFNNNLDNLRVITIEQNIRKRYKDNPDMHFNQWTFVKQYEESK